MNLDDDVRCGKGSPEKSLLAERSAESEGWGGASIRGYCHPRKKERTLARLPIREEIFG